MCVLCMRVKVLMHGNFFLMVHFLHFCIFNILHSILFSTDQFNTTPPQHKHNNPTTWNIVSVKRVAVDLDLDMLTHSWLSFSIAVALYSSCSNYYFFFECLNVYEGVSAPCTLAYPHPYPPSSIVPTKITHFVRTSNAFNHL